MKKNIVNCFCSLAGWLWFGDGRMFEETPTTDKGTSQLLAEASTHLSHLSLICSQLSAKCDNQRTL